MLHPSMRERRKIKRRRLTYYMLVMDASTQETIGHLVDITPQGCMLDCQNPLPLEKEYRLRLDTTPDVSDKGYIIFNARSKWCLTDVVEPSLYDIGFSITKISAHDAAILGRIADKYASQDDFSYVS